MASPEQSPEKLDARSNGSKEPRDARRRRELIEATIDSIARSGLSGTTVARVAELAGLSAGIVSFYFQTKDALLLATLEHVDRAFERRQQEALSRAGDDPVRRLEAMMIVADAGESLVLTGTGDVLEPDDAVMGIGSGGVYALAAARALLDGPLGAEEIARKAMAIAAKICVYTNDDVTVETLDASK